MYGKPFGVISTIKQAPRRCVLGVGGVQRSKGIVNNEVPFRSLCFFIIAYFPFSEREVPKLLSMRYMISNQLHIYNYLL